MERHGADLEGDTRQHEDDAEQCTGGEIERKGGADAVVIGRTGETVDQADAVEDDARCQRTEHEVLEPGLARPVVLPQEAGQHVARQARHFETDVERHQVGGGHHDAHADRVEQHQHGIFGAVAAQLGEETRGDDQDRRRREIDQHLAEAAEGIGAVKIAEGPSGDFACAAVEQADAEDRCTDESGHGDDGQQAGGPVPVPRGKQQQDERGDRQADFRRGEIERGSVGHQCAPSSPRASPCADPT